MIQGIPFEYLQKLPRSTFLGQSKNMKEVFAFSIAPELSVSRRRTINTTSLTPKRALSLLAKSEIPTPWQVCTNIRSAVEMD